MHELMLDLSVWETFICLVSDELLLPHMKKVDGMITDNRKRLLHKLHIGHVLKVSVSVKLQINCKLSLNRAYKI